MDFIFIHNGYCQCILETYCELFDDFNKNLKIVKIFSDTLKNLNSYILDDNANLVVVNCLKLFEKFSYDVQFELSQKIINRYYDINYELFVYFYYGEIINKGESLSLYLKFVYFSKKSDFENICKLIEFKNFNPKQVQTICSKCGIDYFDLKLKCQRYLSSWKKWTENFD